MRRLHSPLTAAIIIAAVLISSVSAVQPQSQDDDCRYFTETRHRVCGAFREFYETRGGNEIFGHPLTEAFDDPSSGLRVQYFQRARMEWHPENAAPYKVMLGLLVDDLGYEFPAVDPSQIPQSNSAIHHYFPETGHVVSYAFLNYFREKGGVDIFGYPRSEFMYENGYIVQYFQRARMEWHPEELAGPQMRLTNLGETYIEQFGVPEEYSRPVSPIGMGGEITPATPVTALRASASVRHVITGRQGRQTVFIYVTDQGHQPVQGSAVGIVVHYQSGDQPYECEPTNASGFTQCSFDIQEAPPGRKVVIDVTVTHNNLTCTTQTFFLPWW